MAKCSELLDTLMPSQDIGQEKPRLSAHEKPNDGSWPPLCRLLPKGQKG